MYKRLATALLAAATAMSLAACTAVPKNETISDAEDFYNTYGEDTEYTCDTTITETIVLKNPQNGATVTIPATIYSSFDQSPVSDDKTQRNIHGTYTRQYISGEITYKYGGEFYVTRKIQNTGRITDTTYWKDGIMANTGEWSDTQWKKSQTNDMTAALLTANKFGSDYLSNGDYTYVNNTSTYKITGNILELFTQNEAESLLKAVGFDGMTVNSVDWPMYVGEDGNQAGMSDTEKKLQTAKMAVEFNGDNMTIKDISTDNFAFEAEVVINNTALQATVTCNIDVSFSNIENVEYSDTIVPASILTETKGSTTISDLFQTPTPSTETTEEGTDAGATGSDQSATEQPAEEQTTQDQPTDQATTDQPQDQNTDQATTDETQTQ